jgi:Fe-S cluster biogenesis protein NfuA
MDAQQFQSRLERLDALVREVERSADPACQKHAREIVQALLELHGLGLERLLEHVANAGEAGQAILDECARDAIVSGLLLLHDLHPLGVDERVRQALEDVRPALRAHGGNVELLDVSDGLVHLRLQGNCQGCPSSAATMQQTIEEAILARAPEVTAIKVEGAIEAPPLAANGTARVALPIV